MNTVAWCIQHPGPKGVKYVWAMCGTSVLCISDDPGDAGKVFQWGHGTERAAKDRCIDRIENAEEHGARLTDKPVFFDLPSQAVAEIRPWPAGWWLSAPNLYQALAVLMS